ncbi:L,D-transpeptidase family protein [Thiohalophilus thiocyanatoxydans]|uniref:Murein L,D-transpeptidase YcbB/YkuD n=1 Tax=Thiohalophilus thiocyanatoxydans TaxID=381308 RepID=A0A4R8ITG4_9GAMM|nr:L,D-transpeptidase family protein [Thiohalophilus thiocyanatoxydans]TDY04351.1 murein L,D-transpeptidase YcbB/YkuD [Thiohalophilus thiocyanatoxydans]
MIRLALLSALAGSLLWLPGGEALAAQGREAQELKSMLNQSVVAGMSVELDRDRLREFYASRTYRPLWVDRFGPSILARQLREVLENADREGLEPKAYHLKSIDRHWLSTDATIQARLDLLLTDAFFLYSRHVSRGRYDPFEIDPHWNIDVPEIDPIALLESTLEAENFSLALRNLAPPHTGYRWLRDALAEYRRLAAEGGWPTIRTDENLKYGQTHAQIAVLRRRLMAEGDLQLPPVHDANYFDQSLKFAVERFQVRHGLEMDGIVGPGTRAALNVPVSDRIERIKLNMERWRWLPRALGERYIMVNTANFELLAFDKNKPMLGMSVITGKQERPTPVIQGLLHTLVLNPYWTLPRSIAVEDMLPRQQRNPDFLPSKGIHVFANGEELDPRQIDWSAVSEDYFPYVLRQDPGPDNALGRIKFLFSNNFDIYLHDTPSRWKFDQAIRTFSSGCIRVQEPYKLASYLLRSQPEWSEQTLKVVTRSGENREIPLLETLPVYLLYFTAWVGSDGTTSFYPDVYDLDQINPSFCIASNP